MAARQSVRRKQRRQVRPLRQQARPASEAPASQPSEEGTPAQPRQAALSPTRMALHARAAEMARLEAVYLRHDLRNIAIIVGLMLVIVVGLSFVLH